MKQYQKHLREVYNSVHILTMNLTSELQGKAFKQGETQPLRALEHIREALFQLQMAQLKLGN